MNNTVTQGDGSKTRSSIILAIAVALVLLVVAGVLYNHHMLHNTETQPTSWDGVPAMLDIAVRSAQYREGGRYLANPRLPGNASDVQRDAYSYRLAIDFLKSLTPKQVELFQHKQALPFTQLTPNQQKTLILASGSRMEGYSPSTDPKINESYILVGTTQTNKIKFILDWVTPLHNGMGGIFFRIYLSTNGEARFLAPYLHATK
ncbi:MAG TPA: hypothetical protein VHV83_11785 [Armatimonadota bacterium]|nr:hypothetical protein [Armatimonadota bacterium]